MEISDQIIKVLDDLGARMGVVIDWAGANVVPKVAELCGKYIMWEIATSIAWLVIGILMVVSALFLWRWAKQTAKNYTPKYSWECDWPDRAIVVSIIAITLGVVGMIVIKYQIFDIIKCAIFPELQIYQYVQHMISH